jgi:hypothetical protein
MLFTSVLHVLQLLKGFRAGITNFVHIGHSIFLQFLSDSLQIPTLESRVTESQVFLDG